MKAINLFTFLITTSLLTACGSAGNRSLGTDTGGGGSSSPITSPGSNLPPGQEVDFLVGGTNGGHGYEVFQTPLVYTDSNLSVKITPLPANNLIIPGAESYTVKYSCVKFLVKVNGISRWTDFISVAGATPDQSTNTACAGKGTSQTLTFPGIVTGSGTPVVIEMSSPQYDNCRNFGVGQEWLAQSGCAMSNVWSTGTTTLANGNIAPPRSHLIRGTVCVAADGQNCF
jgi:hypothetical protein